MRRLAIFWLACAAIGFLAAIGAAFALSLALDAAAWRSETPPPRLVQRKGAASSVNTTSAGRHGFLAPMLGSAN